MIMHMGEFFFFFYCVWHLIWQVRSFGSVNLFHVWLNIRQLDPHSCFYSQCIVITGLENSTVYTYERIRVGSPSWDLAYSF